MWAWQVLRKREDYRAYWAARARRETPPMREPAPFRVLVQSAPDPDAAACDPKGDGGSRVRARVHRTWGRSSAAANTVVLSAR